MLYAIVAVLILILDQATKYWTTLNITLDTGVKEFIPGLVHFANIHNYGAAYGFLQNARWFFVILTAIFVIAVIVLLAIPVVKGKFGRWMMVVVMAGALGNCIDRLFLGYVVDMIELEFITFPVFNVADIFITLGGIAFCLYIIFHKDEDEEDIEEAAERDRNRRMRGQTVAQQQVANIDDISRNTGRFQAVRPQTEVAEVAKTAEDARRRRPAHAQHAAGRHVAQSHRQQQAQPAQEQPVQPVQQARPAQQSRPVPDFDPSDPFAEWESASATVTSATAPATKAPEYSAPVQKPAETRARAQYKPAVSYSVPTSEPVRRAAPQPRHEVAYTEPASEPVAAEPRHTKPAYAEQPEYTEPAPKAEPAPAAKADDMSFSLEDILAEFKDL